MILDSFLNHRLTFLCLHLDNWHVVAFDIKEEIIHPFYLRVKRRLLNLTDKFLNAEILKQ